MTLNYLSGWGSCFVFNVKRQWQDILPHFSPQAENDTVFIISIPFFLYSAILIKRHKHQHYYLDLENCVWGGGGNEGKGHDSIVWCLTTCIRKTTVWDMLRLMSVKINWNMKRLHVLKVKLDNLSQAPQISLTLLQLDTLISIPWVRFFSSYISEEVLTLHFSF